MFLDWKGAAKFAEAKFQFQIQDTFMYLLRLPIAPERAELEVLHRAPRRDVIMPPFVDQREFRTKNHRERSRIVPHDRQSAAAFRTVGGEGADGDMPRPRA
jgi:hypothetical protein